MFCWHNAEFLNVKVTGTFSDHCALKGSFNAISYYLV